MPFLPSRAFALVLILSLCFGCSRAPDLSPRNVTLRTTDEQAQFWPVEDMRNPGPGLLIFSAPGSSMVFWEGLARAAQAEGYRVLVCPPPAPGDAEALTQAYTDQYAAWCRDHENTTRQVFVCEGPALPFANALAVSGGIDDRLPAIIAFSPDAQAFNGDLEAHFKTLAIPLLLLTCENDMQSVQAAQRIKDAAPGYCELQRYACGVRGVDLLAAAPNLTQQILTWLRPIVGEGLGRTSR